MKIHTLPRLLVCLLALLGSAANASAADIVIQRTITDFTVTRYNPGYLYDLATGSAELNVAVTPGDTVTVRLLIPPGVTIDPSALGAAFSLQVGPNLTLYGLPDSVNTNEVAFGGTTDFAPGPFPADSTLVLTTDPYGNDFAGVYVSFAPTPVSTVLTGPGAGSFNEFRVTFTVPSWFAATPVVLPSAYFTVVGFPASETSPPAVSSTLADALAKMRDLTAYIMSLNLKKGISNSLDAKLAAAMRALDDLNQQNNCAARGALEALKSEAAAQRGNQIPADDADEIIRRATEILARVGCS